MKKISEAMLHRIVYIYGLCALALPCLVLAFTEPLGGWVKASALLIPVAAYLWLLTLAKRPGKTVWWMFLVVFLCAFQIVISYLFERSVIAVDMFLNLLTTNGGEAGEVLTQIWPSVVIVCVVYIPLLVLATLSARGKEGLSLPWKRKARKCALATAITGIACGGMSIAVADSIHPLSDVFPLNVIYNLGLATHRTYQQTQYESNTASFTFDARSTREADSAEVYVLVVGETARYDYMAEGDVAKRSDVVNFEKAFTQSNTTHKSVPMLLSPADAHTFNQLPHIKGLLAAFHEAGFHTAFVSNQKRNHSYIDLLAAQADTTIYINDTNPTEGYFYDGDMLPYVSKLLQKPFRKQLIVLHAYGQHFEYGARYPHTDGTAASGSRDKAMLLKEYGLASRYMDQVIGQLIDLLQGQNTCSALLYTSDHGENLMDDHRKKFLHASPVPSYYELHIPLMIWTSGLFQKDFPTLAQQLKAHETAVTTNSEAVFHTMLTLAGITTPWLQNHFSLASTNYREPMLHYLDDHNEEMTLKEMRLDKIDYQLLEKTSHQR